jgi:hypothetical protein
MEEWFNIPKFDCYEINKKGEVRHKGSGDILKPNVDRYARITLRSYGKSFQKYIHQLLAIVFIPNPENKPWVDHINRNKLDNRIENLRWCNASENGLNVDLKKNNISLCNQDYNGSYQFQKTIKGKKYSKCFKTYQDALNYREEFISCIYPNL